MTTETKLAEAKLVHVDGMNPGVSDEQKAQLEAELDPNRVRTVRGKSYLAVHDVIRTANRIFGYGRWGYEVMSLNCLGSTTKTKDGKAGFYVGYSCSVKLTVAGCLPVSGVGYGDGIEYQEQAPVTAHELAVKEAESDALKRAFRNFGDQFGLILYAKDDEKKRIEAEKETEAAKAETGQPAEATKALPNGDRVVNDEEVEAFVDIAKKLGNEQWALDKLVEIRASNAKAGFGHIVNMAWYKPMFAKLVQKAAEQGVGTTDDPAGDAEAAERERQIAEAFEADTNKAA